MKLINKLMAVAIPLLAMVAVSACSSDEPDPYKGKVDSHFLSTLVRGDESVLLQLNGFHTARKKATDDEWQETFICGWSASSFVIVDGKALSSVSLMNPIIGYSILLLPWDIYCRETGYDKYFALASPFVVDAANKMITIGTSKYNIDKADGNELNMSEILEWDIDGEPGLTKVTYCYIKMADTVSPEKYIIVNTEKEAKLAMLKLLRERYGDVMELKESDLKASGFQSLFESNPMIDLAAVEDDIVNNRDEWYTWKRVTFPDLYPSN